MAKAHTWLSSHGDPTKSTRFLDRLREAAQRFVEFERRGQRSGGAPPPPAGPFVPEGPTSRPSDDGPKGEERDMLSVSVTDRPPRRAILRSSVRKCPRPPNSHFIWTGFDVLSAIRFERGEEMEGVDHGLEGSDRALAGRELATGGELNDRLEVVSLEIRKEIENLLLGHAVRDHIDDHRHGDSEAPDTRNTTQLVLTDGDAGERHDSEVAHSSSSLGAKGSRLRAAWKVETTERTLQPNTDRQWGLELPGGAQEEACLRLKRAPGPAGSVRAGTLFGRTGTCPECDAPSTSFQGFP